jgi:hypothetical protein
LAESAVPYDDHQISIPGVGFSSPSSSDVADAGAMALLDDAIEVSADGDSGVGVFVDTSSVKRLVVKQDAEPSFAGRIHVVCYDADGAILADDGENSLLRTSRFMTAAWKPDLFGGCYQATRDEPSTQWDNGFLAVVADEVAAVRVVFWKGTHPMRLRGFSIVAQESGAPSVWSGVPGPARPNGVAVQPPVSGVWPKGTFIPNAKMALERGRYAVTGWLKVSDAETNRPGDDWMELRSECQIPGRG